MFQTERLKQLRKKRRLSQATVAEDLNLTREAYSMYETGRRQPSCENLAALSRYFHVSSDYLIGLVDIPQSLADYPSKERHIIFSLHILDDTSLDFILSAIQFRYPSLTFPEDYTKASSFPRFGDSSSREPHHRRSRKTPHGSSRKGRENKFPT